MPFTTQQMLEIFGVTPPTLTRWKRQGAKTALLAKNRWDGHRLLTWWHQNIGSAGAEALAAEKLRLMRAKASHQEHRNAVQEKRFMPTAVVSDYLFRSGRTIRDQVQAIPDRVAALVAAEQDPFTCKQILKKEFDFILQGLADALRVPGGKP